MDTPQLIVKLSGYGISLCVRDQKLVYSSETPIPKGIALTISAHEKKLFSYLAGNKPAFRANESESHNLTKQSRPKNGGVGSADNLTSSKVSELVEESSISSKVPNQAQDSSAPLLNKGRGETADKDTYRSANETASGGSESIHQADNLANYQRASNMHLPPVLLLNLLAWVSKFHELGVEHPNGLILDARPEHVRDAAKLHPWGVVYDPERYLLMSWGDVPTYALRGKRDLETDELLIPEVVAA